jgi:aryl-alcohol dehydrogenase-like predicted oxidoreductase
MRYKKPERLEREVSAVGFGTWNISGQWNNSDDDEAVRAVDAALDAGITLFDTAPIYGFGHAEEVLGRALKGRRDEAFIASKCGLVWTKGSKRKVANNLSPESLKQEIDQVLKRLQTDRVDLWQIHWPNDDYPLSDTIGALEEIRTAGKILAYGACNFSADRMTEALKYGSPVSHQGLYNLLERNPSGYHGVELEYRSEDEILPQARELGLAFFPYSPLMQGLLSGKISSADYFASKDVRNSNAKLKGERLEQHLRVVSKLIPLAEELGVSLAELSIAWLVQKEEVTSVIAGARTVEQIRTNAVAADLTLDRGLLDRIDLILEEHSGILE